MEKVTCICPTMESRRSWIPQLLDIFESQTYPNKELLFIADGPWIEEFCQRPKVRFLIAGGAIGIKRNQGVRFADGEIVCHFDDDDWADPRRLADQVTRLKESGKQVTGYCRMLFTDGSRWWKYWGIESFAFGTSLCYRRQWALDHPFPPKQISEDNDFVSAAADARQIVSVDAGELMYATIHEGNTSKRVTSGGLWLDVDRPPDWAIASLINPRDLRIPNRQDVAGAGGRGMVNR